ncbi:hypothetical protein TNCV_2691731 [Trichonephila clavipes]|uniref:Uncharacterized protein n=1 Tax=Trichonephila clavipes TaxID=2585209 RepID=A0A8X6VYM9_TRICX|nr:hypothetical protein TNCV_2691731 [Trichonephila clavipes]
MVMISRLEMSRITQEHFEEDKMLLLLNGNDTQRVFVCGGVEVRKDVLTYVQHLSVLDLDFETRFDNALTMAIPQWRINSYGHIEEKFILQ